MDREEYLNYVRQTNPEVFDAFTEDEIIQFAQENYANEQKQAGQAEQVTQQPEKPLAIRPEMPTPPNPYVEGLKQGASFNWLDELGGQDMNRYYQAKEESPFKVGAAEIGGGALTTLALAALARKIPGLAPLILKNPKLAPTLAAMATAFVSGAGAGEEGEKLETGATTAATAPILGYGLQKTGQIVGSVSKNIVNPRTWKNISDFLRFKALGGPSGTTTQTVINRNIGSGESAQEFRSRVADISRQYPELIESPNQLKVVRDVLDKFTEAKQNLFKYARDKGLNIPYSEVTVIPKKAVRELKYMTPEGKLIPSFKPQIKELKTISEDIATYKPSRTYYDERGIAQPGLDIDDADSLRSVFGRKAYDKLTGESKPYSNAYGQMREGIQRNLGPKGQEYSDILKKINTLKAVEDIFETGGVRDVANQQIGLGLSSMASAIKPTGNVMQNLQTLGAVTGITKYGSKYAYPVTEGIQSGLEAVGKPFVYAAQTPLGQMTEKVMQEAATPVYQSTARKIMKR